MAKRDTKSSGFDPLDEAERFDPRRDGPNLAYEHIHRYLLARRAVSGLRVLDLASGSGFGSKILEKTARSVTSIDLERAGLRELSHGVQGDALRLPFADASFDAVVCFEAIEHVSDPAKLVREVRRVLTDPAIFLVSTPDRDIYTDRAGHRNAYHVAEMDRDEFRTLLRPRFKSCRILGQGMWAGSWIAKSSRVRDASEVGTRTVTALRVDGIQPDPKRAVAAWSDREHDALPVPVYLVALCADSNAGRDRLASTIPDDSLLHDPEQWLLGQYDAFANDWGGELDSLRARIEQAHVASEDQASQITRARESIAHLESALETEREVVARLEQELAAAAADKAERVRLQEADQARRDALAEELREVRNDHARLTTEVERAGEVVEAKSVELSNARAAVDAHALDLENARSAIDEQAADLERARSVIDEQAEEITSAQSIIEEQRAEIERAARVIEGRASEVETASRAAAERDAEIARAQGLIEGYVAEIAQAAQSIEEYRADVGALRSLTEGQEGELAAARTVIDSHERELEQARTNAESLRVEIDSASRVHDEQVETIDRLRESHEALSSELVALRAHTAGVEAELEGAREAARDYESQIASSREVIDSYEAESVRVREAYAEHARSLQAANAEVDLRGKALDDLQSAIALERKKHDEDHSQHRARIQAMEREVEASVFALSHATEHQEVISDHCDVLRESCEDLEGQVEIARRAIAEKEAEITAASTAIEQLESEIRSASDVMASKEREISSASESVEALQRELARAGTAVDHKEQELAAAAEAIEAKQHELEGARDAFAVLEREIEEARHGAEEARRSVEEARVGIDVRDRELAEVRVRLEALEAIQSRRLVRWAHRASNWKNRLLGRES